MSKIKTFWSQNLGSVRVVLKDNEPWFALTDVLKVLGYTSASMITKTAENLDQSEKGFAISETLGGTQRLSIISESGLYYLICTSRKSKAKEFRLWVTNTVLPSIRKSGGYIEGQEALPKKDRAELEKLVSSLSKEIENLTRKNNSLEETIENLRDELEQMVEDGELERVAAYRGDMFDYLGDDYFN